MSAQTVLFDAPGPRARARHRALTVVGGVLALGIIWLVLARMKEKGQLEPALWKPFIQPATWVDYLLPGLLGTFKAAAIAIVLAGVLGLLVGVGRLSEHRIARVVSGVVVEFFRAVPVLIMMIFSFGIYAQYGVFKDSINPLAAVVTGLTLYNGSVLAELVRAGVFGLPKGQREAGLSIGLTPSQTLRAVLLPQALTAMLPALIGQLVVVLKDSALGTIITYEELLNWSKTLGSAEANTIPAYIVAALLFIVINFGLTLLARRVQQRLTRRGITTRTTGPAPAMGLDDGTAAVAPAPAGAPR